MLQPEKLDISALSIRKAKVLDADKVRYRVYRTAEEYVAVIAESALMAMRVSGIAEPYRIVRDLPTHAISVEAERMAKIELDQAETIDLQLETKPFANVSFKMATPVEAESLPFTPIGLRGLHLSAEDRRPSVPNVAAPETLEPDQAAPTIPEEPSVAQAPPTAPVTAEEPATLQQESHVAPAVEPAPIEYPAPQETTSQPPSAAPKDEALSPEEVEKLLNQ